MSVDKLHPCLFTSSEVHCLDQGCRESSRQICHGLQPEEVLAQVVQLLQREWPENGPCEEHERRIIRAVAQRDRLKKAPLEDSEVMFRPLGSEAGAVLPATIAVISCAGSQVLGYCIVRPGPATLAEGQAAMCYSVVVHPEHRRKGIGKRLMQAAEDQARLAGYSYLYLTTPDQKAFYQRCGFQPTVTLNSLKANASQRLSSKQILSIQSLMSRIGLEQRAAAGEDLQLRFGQKDGAKAEQDTLRKQLIPEHPVRMLRESAITQAVHGWMLEQFFQHPPETGRPWLSCFFRNPFWQRQLGPTCGLALLRPLQKFAQHSRKSLTTLDEVLKCTSLTWAEEDDRKDTSEELLRDAPIPKLQDIQIEKVVQELQVQGFLPENFAAPTPGDHLEVADSIRSPGDELRPENLRNSSEGLTLLDLARSLDLTEEGGMFSVMQFVEFAQSCLGFGGSPEAAEGAGKGGATRVEPLKLDRVLSSVLQGRMCMVVYDRDRNNTPFVEKSGTQLPHTARRELLRNSLRDPETREEQEIAEELENIRQQDRKRVNDSLSAAAAAGEGELMAKGGRSPHAHWLVILGFVLIRRKKDLGSRTSGRDVRILGLQARSATPILCSWEDLVLSNWSCRHGPAPKFRPQLNPGRPYDVVGEMAVFDCFQR